MDQISEAVIEDTVLPEKAWSVSLRFHRPSKMTDEEMRTHFPRHDGQWSGTTATARLKHSATGLDLNENWALTAPFWRCPACLRSKDQIVRLNPRSILLAKLELHHDHLSDTLFSRANARFGGEDWRKLISGATMVVDQIRELVRRFAGALVCSECNAADGAVKLKFRDEIPADFTFTVEEIAEFITPRPNDTHIISFERAQAIWIEQKSHFQFRLGLIDQLLTALKAGQISHSVGGGVSARNLGLSLLSPYVFGAAFEESTRNSNRRRLLYGYYSEFLARSVSTDSARLVQHDKKNNTIRVPTDEDFRQYSDPNSNLWSVTSGEWTCPVCGRAKRAVMRWSNAKRWAGAVRSYLVAFDEQDESSIANRSALFPEFTNDRFVGMTEHLSICSDCADVPTLLRRKAPSIEDPFLAPDDVRASLRVITAHRQHEIDFDEAAWRARSNESIREALQAFNQFSDLAVSFSTRYKIRRRGGAHDVAISGLTHDLPLNSQLTDADERYRLTVWLIEQGDQFK